MEIFDRKSIDELLEIRQYFPRQNFALYGILFRSVYLAGHRLKFLWLNSRLGCTEK